MADIKNATVPDTSPEIAGDFADFLRMLKSAEADFMSNNEAFNPLLSVEMSTGEAFVDKPKPDDDVVVTFVSGIEGKWNYRESMKFRDFLRWKVRAKTEAHFSFS